MCIRDSLGAVGRGGGRQMARRGEIDVVVEQVDDGQRAGEARPLVEGAGPVEDPPGVEHGVPHGPPVGPAASLRRELPGIREQHLGLRRRLVGPPQHPQVERDVVSVSYTHRIRDSSTAVPPSFRRASACCTQASSDSVRAGKPYSQRGS